MIWKKKYLIIFIVFLLLFSLLLLAFRVLSEKDWVKIYMVTKLEEAIGKDVEVKSLRFTIFPEFSIIGGDLHIYDREEVQLLSAPMVKVTLGLSTFFLGQPSIKSLSFFDPVIFIKRDQEGRLNILKDLPVSRGITIPVKKILIQDGRVFFHDQKVRESIEMEKTDILIDTSYLGRRIYFEVTGRLGREKRFGRMDFKGGIEILQKNLKGPFFSVEGSFNSLDSTLFTPYIRGKGDAFFLKGHISGELTFKGDLRTGFLSGKISSKKLNFFFKPYYPEPLNPKGIEMLFTLNYDEKGFSLRELNGELDGVEITSSLSVDLTRQMIKGRLKASRFGLSWFNTYMPFIKEWDKGRLLKYIKAGVVELKEISFEGSLDDLLSKKAFIDRKPLKARVDFSDIELEISKAYLPIKPLTGRMSFSGDRLVFDKVKGRYGDTFIKDLSGSVDRIFTAHPEIKMMIKSDINLREIEPLTAFLPRLREHLMVLKDLEGRLDLNLSIKKIVGIKGVEFNGGASLDGLGFIFPSIPLKASQLTGRFSFTSKDINIEELNGFAGHSFFSLHGTIGGYNTVEPDVEIKADYTLKGEEIRKLMPLALKKKEIKVEGKVLGALSLSGRVSQGRIQSSMDLTGLAYGSPQTFFKPEGILNVISLRGKYKRSGRFSDLLIRLTLMDEEINVKGDVKDINNLDGEWDVDFGGIDLSNFKKVLILSKGYSPSGLVRGKFHLKGSLLNLRGLKTSGEIKSIGASFIPSPDSVPIKNLTFTLRFKEDTIDIPSLYLERGKSVLEGTITSKGFVRPRVRFNIFSNLWRERDFPPDERLKRRVMSFVKGGSVKGHIVIKKGRFNNVSFQSLDSSVAMRGEKWEITLLKCKLQDGIFTGVVTIIPQDDGRSSYLMNVKWVGGDIKKVFSEWLGEEKIATGHFNASAILFWEGSNKEEYIRSLNGKIRAKLERGRIFKLFNILPKLLGLLNPMRVITLDLPSFRKRGMEYKKVKGDFTIKGGELYTEDLVIEGKEMRILWMGKVDLNETTIDSIMAVQPFEGVDKILEKTLGKIPLIGKIIIGKDKKLLVLYYKVEGDLKDPDVKGANVKGLEKGILDRFKMLLPGI